MIQDNKIKRRCCIYLRISSEEQINWYWLEVQKNKILWLLNFKSDELELATYLEKEINSNKNPDEKKLDNFIKKEYIYWWLS